MKTAEQLYEELRAAVDNGHESMTHEDALTCVRSMHDASSTSGAEQPVGAQPPGDCGNTPYDEGPFTLAQQPGAAYAEPQFPAHPESMVMDWSALEIRVIAQYGRDMYEAGKRASHGQAPAQEAPAAVAGLSEPKCSACGARLQEVTRGPNSYLSADQFDADKLGDWFCECCPEGPNKGSRKHRYFDNYELAAPTTQPASRLPERDASIPAEQQGLFRKFDVRRVDGSDQPGGKHHGCTYFVLDLDHDPHARQALVAYAAACESTHPALSADLRTKWGAVPTTQPAPQADSQPAGADRHGLPHYPIQTCGMLEQPPETSKSSCGAMRPSTQE